MFPIRQQPRRRHPYMFIDRLDPSVRAFDEEFGVEETFDAEDDAVGASESYGDADRTSASAVEGEERDRVLWRKWEKF